MIGGNISPKPAGWTIARLVAAVMLVFALADNSYSYYKLLRWAVCSVAAFSALKATEMAKRGWAWTLAISAALFNPIIPVHPNREFWRVFDLVLAAIFITSIFRLSERRTDE